MTIVEGSELGAYRLSRRLGAGGMGEVWVGEHAMLGRRAAVKVLHESFASRPEIVTRFFNEARAATAIADPGIVQVFDFGQTASGVAFIIMELLEGESLEQRFRRRGSLGLGEVLRLVRQVAASLGAAHARGIVHRDLKPDNVFVVRDAEVLGGERAKILDFGIAKLATDNQGVKTQTSALMGTPMFMSPEQCRGAGGVDQRSDVYSLACMMFLLLAGRPPFIADGAGELIILHVTEPAPPLTAFVDVPPDVAALIDRCLAKDPARRPADGHELAIELGRLQDRYSSIATAGSAAFSVPPAPTTLSSASTALPSASPRAGRLGLAALGLAVLLGGGAVAIAKLGGDEPAAVIEPAAKLGAVEPAAIDGAVAIDAAIAPPDAAPDAPVTIDAGAPPPRPRAKPRVKPEPPPIAAPPEPDDSERERREFEERRRRQLERSKGSNTPVKPLD